MKEFPTKEVNAPYIVQPDDLGFNLKVMTAGTVYFEPILNAAFNRFSMMVVNGSAGNVLLETTAGALIRPAGQLPRIVNITLTPRQSALMAAVPDSLEWMGLNMSVNTAATPAPSPSPSPSPSPAPAPGTEAYLVWGGPGLTDTINGVAANSNPTLANGSTFPFVVHVVNPLGVPVLAQFTEVYTGVSAGSNFGPQVVPGNAHIQLNGTITVNGVVGGAGYIRLTLADPYGATQRADIPFVIGAPVGGPSPSPSPSPTPTFVSFQPSSPTVELGSMVSATLLFTGPPDTSITTNIDLQPDPSLSGPSGMQVGVTLNFNSSGNAGITYSWLATELGNQALQASALSQTHTATVNVMNLETGS